MNLDVEQRGHAVATFRGILVALMETAAGWVPTTPEMEVKLLFGSHVWDLAQHADALGKRTHELRLPLQHSVPPTDAYAGLLREVRALAGTGERIAALYEVMLPGLAARYRHYLGQTDALMDAPTVRILERMLADVDRMLDDQRALSRELPHLPVAAAAWSTALAHRESGLAAFAEKGAGRGAGDSP